MDLILEDIGKLPKYRIVIRNARKITTYIYNHVKLHNDFLKVVGKELVRCGVTRFATTFLTLQSIRNMCDDLRSFDWLSWVEVGDGLAVSELMIDNRFWKSLEDVLKACQLLVVVMRMVDANAQPCMGLIAHAFQKAKEVVKNNFKNSRSDIEPIFSILDKRWDKHFNKSLFGAGAFLNPSVLYSMDR